MALNAPVDGRPRRDRVVDPDAEFVAAARAQPREFLALYDRYFDRVLGYVRLRVRDLGRRAAVAWLFRRHRNRAGRPARR